LVIAMKWYYKWKLKRLHAEISELTRATEARLFDNYTAHSRLRILNRIAGSLQERLDKSESAAAQ
jgi:hypothetical protein